MVTDIAIATETAYIQFTSSGGVVFVQTFDLIVECQ